MLIERLNEQRETLLDETIIDGGKNQELQLDRRIETLQTAKQRFDELNQIANFAKDEDIAVIKIKIEKIASLFEQYKTVKKQKEEHDSIYKSTVDKIRKLKNQMQQSEQSRTIAQKARNALNDILTKNSKADFLDEFLNENKNEIVEIFKMVHSPKEFEGINFETEEGIILGRGKTQKAARLSEISTGQRSALSLSIFSALNRKLRNGPNILMFDDPVSNIDDLNILSYFDYLREVAIHGNRQVFFATANNNVAFLFAQKFSFLGDNDFKVFNMTR